MWYIIKIYLPTDVHRKKVYSVKFGRSDDPQPLQNTTLTPKQNEYLQFQFVRPHKL